MKQFAAAIFLLLVLAVPVHSQTVAERKTNVTNWVNGLGDPTLANVETALTPFGYVKLTTQPPPPPPVATTGPRYPVGQKDPANVPTETNEPSFAAMLHAADNVVINPGDSWAAKINGRSTGTWFTVKAGLHQTSSCTPPQGARLMGELGAIVDGGHTKGVCINGSATGVKVQNLTFQNWDSGQTNEGSAGYFSSRLPGLEWRDCTFAFNDGAGVQVTARMARCYCHHGGQGYFSCYRQSGSIIEDNEFTQTNLPNKYPDGYAGTFKFWQCGGSFSAGGCICRYNWSHDNNTNGLWDDTANDKLTYDHNHVGPNNRGTWILHEVGYGATITNNLIELGPKPYPYQWGHNGITVVCGTATISNNTIIGGFNIPIKLRQDNGRSDAVSTVKNCSVLGNIFDTWKEQPVVVERVNGTANSPWTAAANNKFDFNTYIGRGSPNGWLWGGLWPPRTWTQWKAIPQDANGSYTP